MPYYMKNHLKLYGNELQYEFPIIFIL